MQPQFTSEPPETAKSQIGPTRYGKQFFGCVRANNSRQKGVKAHEVSQGIQRHRSPRYRSLLNHAPPPPLNPSLGQEHHTNPFDTFTCFLVDVAASWVTRRETHWYWARQTTVLTGDPHRLANSRSLSQTCKSLFNLYTGTHPS